MPQKLICFFSEFFAVLFGSISRELAEDRAEIGIIVEAGQFADLLDGVVGVFEEQLGKGYADIHQIVDGALADLLFEVVHEVKLADERPLCEHVQRYRFAEIGIHVFLCRGDRL